MADTSNDFEFACLEYKEICQNIRESWSYITSLFRHFLIIQIVLLSLIGLGTHALNAPSTTRDAAQSMSEPKHRSAQDADAFQRELRFRMFARGSTISALIIIGIGLSFGACLQSHRIFFNASNFVKRAAAIEGKFGVPPLKLRGEDVPSTYAYMHSRLTGRDFKMKHALTATYLFAGFLWILIGLLHLVPVIA